MIAPPLSTKQGNICSAWIDSAHHCKHGHIQTYQCNPIKDEQTGEWNTVRFNMIPICQVE